MLERCIKSKIFSFYLTCEFGENKRQSDKAARSRSSISCIRPVVLPKFNQANLSRCVDIFSYLSFSDKPPGLNCLSKMHTLNCGDIDITVCFHA